MVFHDNSRQAKQALENAGKKWVKASAMLVERDAVTLAPTRSGDLKNSITHITESGEILAYVGAQAKHGLFVEKGSGEFASEGGGRQGYWVYVKGQPPGPGGKTHTLQSAKQAMAILRSKGLEAYYTNGSPPKPFLMPAFRQNKGNFQRLAKKYYSEVIG